MFKPTHITAFVAILISSVASADCMLQIAQNEDLDPISPDQAECMNKSRDFTEALSALCLPDKSGPSKKYRNFLVYQKEYIDALAELKSANTPEETIQADGDFQQADTDWSLNYKNEVFADLFTVGQALSFCPAIKN